MKLSEKRKEARLNFYEMVLTKISKNMNEKQSSEQAKAALFLAKNYPCLFGYHEYWNGDQK